ncbi:MAG: glycosyltransferase family 1 protein [Thermus sp.]|uniref:glycosyltransferase family 4 protein n=1 Tax=Thermus sp. TaxID=275 RepID=UPI0033309AF0
MRVLEILEATGGGTARHVVDLCEGLARRGVEVHLAYSPLRMDFIMREGLERLKEAGVRLLELPMRRAPHPSDLWALWRLWRYLKDEGPFHLVHGHSSKGGGIARLLGYTGVKVVYTPNAFVTKSPTLSAVERWVYAWVERALAHKTDVLIAVSQDEAKEAVRLGFHPERIYLIPNSVHLGPTSRPVEKGEELRKKMDIPVDALVIGFVGRLAPQKNPLLLIRAFALVQKKYPDATLVMVGKGPFEELLREEVKRLGLEGKVYWPGAIDGRMAMRVFDVFVLPSDYEGFPYVLLEAMAEGLPVVSTRVGGSEDAILDGENGFIVPVGDPEAMAGALGRLLSDENLRRRFGRKSLERVQAFDVDKMVEATLEVYRALVGGRWREGEQG